MPTTTGLVRKSLDDPEEIRTLPEHGKVHVSSIAGSAVMRTHLEPGWRWSNDVKPVVGGESCQAPHVGYVVSGRIRVRMDDGTEEEFGPGDLMDCPPGHDAWVVGDEDYVSIDWSPGAAKYAQG